VAIARLCVDVEYDSVDSRWFRRHGGIPAFLRQGTVHNS
jgi:hypothetical protein